MNNAFPVVRSARKPWSAFRSQSPLAESGADRPGPAAINFEIVRRKLNAAAQAILQVANHIREQIEAYAEEMTQLGIHRFETEKSVQRYVADFGYHHNGRPKCGGRI